jgi:hypothetical protein
VPSGAWLESIFLPALTDVLVRHRPVEAPGLEVAHARLGEAVRHHEVHAPGLEDPVELRQHQPHVRHVVLAAQLGVEQGCRRRRTDKRRELRPVYEKVTAPRPLVPLSMMRSKEPSGLS